MYCVCRFILCLLLVIVGACSSTVSPTQTHTAPDGTPLKGWQKPYEEFGETYTPLLDHEGFVQKGLASWYGNKFHGRKTSNGETYDMYAMTAAHKTLPLGVFVRVENQANGRSEVVRVNDRGPFVAGRIIDLSYAAANTLGVVGPGTAPVIVTALGYKGAASDGTVTYRLPQAIDRGPFAVQVGAFTQQQNAQRLRSALHQRYGYADLRQAQINGQIFYRVRAGKYSSLTEARQAQQAFLHAGYGLGFVVAID